jgi:HKD family nuclease
MVRIINQPLGLRMGDIIIEQLSFEEPNSYDNFYFIVAFAKKSGVSRIQEAMQTFREGEGIIKGVVGIDSKGTTIQGLQLLLQLTDGLYIYHDENPSVTFHPKLYIFEKVGEKAKVCIGSSNLTSGGLFTNYEMGIELNFDLENIEDISLFGEIKEIFNNYTDIDNPCCKLLDEQLLEGLMERNLLEDEETRQATSMGEGEQMRLGEVEALFGTGTFRPAPQPYHEEIEEEIIEGTTEVTATRNGFWKKLSANDVSRTSSPGQIIIPIWFQSYFPQIGALQTLPSGARQGEVYFNVIYIDEGGRRRNVNGARLILYIPAPHHPRPNRELRFTFRNRTILEQLFLGDILEFRRTEIDSPWFEITRVPAGTPENMAYTNRYGEF